MTNTALRSARPSAARSSQQSRMLANASTNFKFSAGVWQRNYENGVVFVNPTATAQNRFV